MPRRQALQPRQSNQPVGVQPQHTPKTCTPVAKRRKINVKDNNTPCADKTSWYQHGGVPQTNPHKAPLGKLFDQFRDAPKEEPNKISVNGTMKYLEELGVGLEDVAVLIVFDVVKAPTMGEIERQGFEDGWSEVQAETIAKQKTHISTARQHLASAKNRDKFKRIYKHTFIIARPPGQKGVPLDVAIEYWRLLLGQAPSVEWKTANTPWLDWWFDFLQTKWKKSVSRDMWDQTFAFMEQSLADESLGFWNEEAAWPSFIDEFVLYVKEKRGGTA